MCVCVTHKARAKQPNEQTPALSSGLRDPLQLLMYNISEERRGKKNFTDKEPDMYLKEPLQQEVKQIASVGFCFRRIFYTGPVHEAFLASYFPALLFDKAGITPASFQLFCTWI